MKVEGPVRMALFLSPCWAVMQKLNTPLTAGCSGLDSTPGSPAGMRFAEASSGHDSSCGPGTRADWHVWPGAWPWAGEDPFLPLQPCPCVPEHLALSSHLAQSPYYRNSPTEHAP